MSQKRYVYGWADGVYFNVRLEDERTCVLVLVGAAEDGTKEMFSGLQVEFYVKLLTWGFAGKVRRSGV